MSTRIVGVAMSIRRIDNVKLMLILKYYLYFFYIMHYILYYTLLLNYLILFVQLSNLSKREMHIFESIIESIK